MKSKLFHSLLGIILVIGIVFSACGNSSTSSTSQATTSITSTTVQSTTVLSTTTADTTTQANWWDELGEPTHGGTITYAINGTNNIIFDNYNFIGGGMQYWLESLWWLDWKLDRDIWSFQASFTPEEYHTGLLAERWEYSDAQTIVVHLREGVHYQNKEPVNGREFTADDVEQHYDRMLGTGAYTEPSPYYVSYTSSWESITATDKYTVVIKFQYPTGVGFSTIADFMGLNTFEPPEIVEATEGNLTDWTKVVGTGPWMLTDFVSGASMTYSKNPDYWGYDERHPDNQIPYADELKALVISDSSTSMAAFRTGKIDMLQGLTWQQIDTLEESNPGFSKAVLPGTAPALEIRCDTEPYNDINVRKALQMSIDRESIAAGYYNGTVESYPCGLVNPVLTGYCFAYEDWPQSLKDEYSYNPEKAKQLLSEAGYPDGFSTNVVAASMGDVQLLQVIKDELLDIGVDMEINSMDPGTWRSYVLASKHDQLVYGSVGMPFSPNMDISFRDSRDKANNRTFNNDAGYDAIVDQFKAAITAEEVKQYMLEADKYSIEQHWVVVAVPTNSNDVWHSYLKGRSGESTGSMGTGNFWARLWLDGK